MAKVTHLVHVKLSPPLMMHNLGTFRSLFSKTLQRQYAEGEIRTITNWIGEEILGKDPRLFSDEVIMEPDQWEQAMGALKRLEAGEPVQYVMGYTLFYGRRFRVSEHVLIPRPETEELVSLVLEQISSRTNRSGPIHLLDVGTGSGCIAITLWLELHKKGIDAKVTGWDVSAAALEVARHNAGALQAEVMWQHADMFQPDDRLLRQVDGIVSNPPYVPLAEKHEMTPQVLAHEPHMALFVYDNDPLSSYRALANMGNQYLVEHGGLWVEIHREFAGEVKQLFEENGYEKVMIYQDLRKNNRMVSAIIST